MADIGKMRRRFERLSTEELLALLHARESGEYGPRAYDVIEGILDERGVPAADRATPLPSNPERVRCPYCREEILEGAAICKHCGSNLTAPPKSNFLAGLLGLLFGPVGLWYKGHWAAGFAWLALAVVVALAGGVLLAPLFWIGMAIHAAAAEPAR